jgi:hypothetical protein
MTPSFTPRSSLSCTHCRHFNPAPADIEAAFPGLWSLSSAYASVRADDGICAVHDRYVAASSVCAVYDAAAGSASTCTRQS